MPYIICACNTTGRCQFCGGLGYDLQTNKTCYDCQKPGNGVCDGCNGKGKAWVDQQDLDQDAQDDPRRPAAHQAVTTKSGCVVLFVAAFIATYIVIHFVMYT